MPDEKWLAERIYSRYGEVKRARESFLYTEKGVRLTDLYQMGGRAILGWQGGKARLAFKNVFERSQTGFFETHFSAALEKAVKELFPCVSSVRIAGESSVKKLGVPEWKPWLSEGERNASEEDLFYFLPPFAFCCDYVICCARDESFFSSENFDSPIASPALVAAFTRSVYDLMAALTVRSEEDFKFFDRSIEKYFMRHGPYLTPKVGCDKYEKFVEFCLENEVVISPDYDVPSIIPFGADYGVLRKLSKSEFKL